MSIRKLFTRITYLKANNPDHFITATWFAVGLLLQTIWLTSVLVREQAVPAPAHIAAARSPAPVVPDHPILRTEFECLADAVMPCGAHVERDASLSEIAAFLHADVGLLRRLNPNLHGSRVRKGNRVTITSCLARNTDPSDAESLPCRVERLGVRPADTTHTVNAADHPVHKQAGH